ncbi:hypothetical protein LQ938_06765 [Microbacterium sp. cx-55]|uniref:hypothetical protein n=1 Tax=Microbacterium sp. cx-55 TaxID=2875948 RepID=UPI001CC19B5B|nr:hypothetical protein [Microbacterium sp. cx-55]MBZ4486553.1 hypothetical protein [Microbacterium sp. cx-55]UGB36479.1 hypothetical protein LQ938_06765 [Microbacterium sp. cx-55]
MTQTVLRQGTQYRGDGFRIGYISTDLRPAGDGGGITARFGISHPDGRSSHTLTEGEEAPLPGGGTLRLVGIALEANGSDASASVEIRVPDASDR